MAKQAIGWTFLIFIVLVGFNYLFTLAGNFFPYGSGGAALAETFIGTGSGSGHQLKSVNFSMFDKNGTGRSYITQGYGKTSFSYEYVGGFHNGIDIAAVYGAPVYSPANAFVLATGNQDDYCPRRGFGKYVAIYDPKNNLILWFAHLGSISVSRSDKIEEGTLIGTIGATGFETGTHLHFSIFKAAGFGMPSRNGCGPDPTGTTANPLSYLGTVYQ